MEAINRRSIVAVSHLMKKRALSTVGEGMRFLVGVLVSIAVCSNVAHAQVEFFSDGASKDFFGPNPLCVEKSGKAFANAQNDCADPDPATKFPVVGLQVGDPTKSITLEAVGPGPSKVGVLSVGTGTHQT